MWRLGATKNLQICFALTIHLLPYPQGDFGRNTYNHDMTYYSNSVSWTLIIYVKTFTNYFFFKEIFFEGK
jgi:hypothetical protein